MARRLYVALLRGINVGGRNAVGMADLRAAFDDAGYRDVRTYINSGNVLFGTDRPSKGLEEQIELEGRLIAANADSVDGHEGVDAFLAKRRPDFA